MVDWARQPFATNVISTDVGLRPKHSLGSRPGHDSTASGQKYSQSVLMTRQSPVAPSEGPLSNDTGALDSKYFYRNNSSNATEFI